MAYIPPSIPLIVTGSTFSRPANTTAYNVGGLVANSTTAGSVVPGTIAAARATNVAGTILKCRLSKSSLSIISALFRIHLWNVIPTLAVGDNGALMNGAGVTLNGYCGSMDVTIDKSGTDISEGIGIPSTGSTIAFTPVSGSQNLYYLIEARNTYTPASGETFTPILEVQ